MPDSNNHDDEFIVLDLVKDAVVSLADAITVVPREFLAAWRSGFLRQALDQSDDALSVFLGGYGNKLFPGRGLYQQPIFCHCA